jgi:hypothetical protein
MIYKSYCAINIEYYPFDIQDCYMKFGTWTYDGQLIDLDHLSIKYNKSHDQELKALSKNVGVSTKLYEVKVGIDMSDYYESVEWDVLSIPAQKNIKFYDCCKEPYIDIYFNLTLRRKTLFYTVNLIIPCVNISFLSVLVFYLPSCSGEKIALGIYVLVALLVFYLLLIELIPPTSLVIPLLGKYLLFTLILVNLSILFTIFILNIHHRKPNTHKMSMWMRRVFIEILPPLLGVKRPENYNYYLNACHKLKTLKRKENQTELFETILRQDKTEILDKSSTASIEHQKFSESIYSRLPDRIRKALVGLKYIHSRLQMENEDKNVKITFSYFLCIYIIYKHLYYFLEGH